ncbi:MAG TPA: DUF4287 domain-containing protein [Anaerolineaceae bacterium]|nr:DUF4287 domain-containing protein [Anaerolineaceae bacterium]HBA90614.1 DUF4287 domain-containing protein [Anaerolineaceae bacterium]
MSSVDKAIETQLNNIEKKTSKSLAEWTALIQQSGLTKHAEIRQMLIDRFQLGYGDANTWCTSRSNPMPNTMSRRAV